MFKKYKKQLIISTIVILLPILFCLLMWDQLPESFATHWGVDGQADGWMEKGLAVFLLPLLLTAFHLFCVWITDLTNRDNDQSAKIMNLIFCIIPLLSLLSNGMVYGIALGKVWDITAAMPIFMGLLFVLLGNYMPKCKQNTTVGIKIIWTLHNEENWNATHRFAGKTWVAGGVITMLSALLPTKIGYPIMFVALMGGGLAPMFYSWLYYRKQLQAGTSARTKDIPVDPTTKVIQRVVRVLVIAILIGCTFVMFAGSIDFNFQDDALVMDATFYSPITLRYQNIEAIEYRDGNVDGVRVGGFGSFKLLLGYFENEEFGTYSRYTYYKPEGCIVVTTKGNTLVFSGENEAETLDIYQELLKRVG